MRLERRQQRERLDGRERPFRGPSLSSQASPGVVNLSLTGRPKHVQNERRSAEIDQPSSSAGGYFFVDAPFVGVPVLIHMRRRPHLIRTQHALLQRQRK